MKRHTNISILLLAVACLFLSSTLASAASFTPLGFLTGATHSDARGISADGSTVVGFSNTATGPQAFYWNSSSGMNAIGDLLGAPNGSRALGASSNGATIVGNGNTNISGSTAEAFSFTQLGGITSVAGPSLKFALDISNDASTIVGQTSTNIAYHRAGGLTTTISPLSGGTTSQATGVSADGSVVVGTSVGIGANDAFLWTTSSVSATPLGGSNSSASAISSDASTIVGRSSNLAFRYDVGATTMTSLGDLPGGFGQSNARDVSADGSVIVGQGSSTSGFPLAAFIWDQTNGMQNLKTLLETTHGLDLTGWNLIEANAVSDNGLIITGTALNPSFRTEAFLVDLTPIPTPLAVTAGLLTFLLLAVRRPYTACKHTA